MGLGPQAIPVQGLDQMRGLVLMRSRTKGISTKRRGTLYHTRAIGGQGEVAVLDERLRAIEGKNRYGLEAMDLCLILDVGLLADLKTPEFDKYKGSTCPRVHLTMYYRKIAAYIYDDKVLIHCFQDNLTGVALNWYTWRDLAEAFLKQYKYNEDIAPDRSWLQSMVKKEQEGFKEYAQRWCELAVQVQPPIIEREMVTMFINTLPSSYYDMIVGNVASNFADLVMVDERIELAFGEGTKAGAATIARPAQQNTRRPPRALAPIPMTYTELLALLLETCWTRVSSKGARRGKEKRIVAKHVVKPVRRVEEGSHSDRSSKAVANSIAYIEGNNNLHPKSFIVHYNSASQTRASFIVQVPARPVYSNNAVPWRYPVGEIMTPPTIRESPAPEVTNIAGTRGVTRSGRIFALENLRNKDPMPAKKEKTTEAPKRVVTKEEAHKFFKMICHSEYEMLDQLHKMLAQIPLLSLLINLDSHQELLLKVLNDAHVPQDITPEKFGSIINNITVSCHLSFSEEEVLVEGRTHNQPLHIVVKCGGYMIAKVLIDNGSSLNVMPKATLDKLHLPGATLKNNPIVVRAFDGSKWEVMGEITLLISIGPKSSTSPSKYIKGDEEALKTFFQALEIIGTTSVEAEGGDPKPSKVMVMAAKVLISNGFQLGKGLGRELHGIAELVTIQENSGRSGLGYTGAIAVVEDQPRELAEWVYLMARELDNWTTEAILDLVSQKIPNTETSHQIDNATLTSDNAGESSRSNEGDDLEEEDLEELERLLE
ncbi:hypothetical protein CR513_36039, partial [Mucuna pruriens]